MNCENCLSTHNENECPLKPGMIGEFWKVDFIELGKTIRIKNIEEVKMETEVTNDKLAEELERWSLEVLTQVRNWVLFAAKNGKTDLVIKLAIIQNELENMLDRINALTR